MRAGRTLCDGFFPGQRDKCRAFLRHKSFLVSPTLVRGAGLPIYKCTQVPTQPLPVGLHVFCEGSWLQRGESVLIGD